MRKAAQVRDGSPGADTHGQEAAEEEGKGFQIPFCR